MLQNVFLPTKSMVVDAYLDMKDSRSVGHRLCLAALNSTMPWWAERGRREMARIDSINHFMVSKGLDGDTMPTRRVWG